jgi:hypothetical protein
MGLEVATVMAISAGVTAFSVYQQMEAADDAKADRQRAYEEQQKAQGEQKAMNAAQEAAAKRQQIREERVKRARIMQSATGTGVGEGSGEFGAVGSLGTQLGGNLGFLAGQNDAAGRISDYNQSASGFLSSAQNKIADANMWGSIGSLSMSIFQGAGGFKSLSTGVNQATMGVNVPMQQLPAPVETR